MPQSGDPSHPKHWVKPDQAGGSSVAFADDPTALAGPNGQELARFVRGAKAGGIQTLTALTRTAIARAIKAGGLRGRLFNSDELQQLAGAVAGLNAAADLWGRSRLRRLVDRTAKRFADDSPEQFVFGAPEQALDYFRGLTPKLGVDPERWTAQQRRRAFTVAESTEQVLTERIQAAIADAIRESRGVTAGSNAIDDLLEAAGVSPKNPQYAEMVFRTNYQDAAMTGFYEEMRAPDVRDEFVAWEYLGIEDSRTGDDHRPKIGKYYPADAPFADVRGPRVFNCRCSFAPLTREQWANLAAAGAKVETRW